MPDPYDMVQDLRAEAAHDGIHLTNAQIVRSTLDYEAEHAHLPLGRHPFGLPPVAVTSFGDDMTPAAAVPSSLSSGTAAATGHTDLPAAA